MYIETLSECGVYREENSAPHKVHIYLEYNSVCPLVGTGTPTTSPLPQASVSPQRRGEPLASTGSFKENEKVQLLKV
jgi:hypothetical protein